MWPAAPILNSTALNQFRGTLNFEKHGSGEHQVTHFFPQKTISHAGIWATQYCTFGWTDNQFDWK